MKRYQNLILLILVVALVAIPLMMIKKPEPGKNGTEVEIFTGSDDQAKNAISTIDPSYKPWAKSLMEPPSGEIESLLFSLQAALGAGFIGYWYGRSSTRARMRQERGEEA
ncbi:MAG TPA: energy-coupling factor ABC transporter substrate-binding protein [Geobacteraceae bacterium]|nr:energy-coupling factor ABC transporter substrate-binding protein [Geobacteraceae bacterium]